MQISLPDSTFNTRASSVLNPTRRTMLAVAASAALLLPALGVSTSYAQSWPENTVRIVVPFPPGGAIDTMTRVLAPHLEDGLKQAVVVENRPGAGGIVGTEAVSRSTDGHTILMTAMGHVIVPALYSKITYDPMADFRALAPVGVVPNVLVVPADSPYQSVQDVIEAAKANPGTLTFGSAGAGSSLHLTPALFAAMADIDLTHVPYRGSGPASIDLVSGRIDMMFDSSTSIAPFVENGKLRPLAVATSKRIDAFPDLPTIAESGLPDYAVDWWYAMLAPKDLSDEAVQKVAALVAETLKKPEVIERFSLIKVEAMEGDTQTLSEAMQNDSKKWGDLVRQLGIHSD